MHTPGPWTVEDPLGDEQLCIVQAGKPTYEWEFIATVGRGDESGGITPTQQGENARLISAAPELLSALKSCMSTLDFAIQKGVLECHGVREAAITAIAKAEGRDERYQAK